MRTFVTELSSPKERTNGGCTLFPQDEKCTCPAVWHKTYRTLSRFEETRCHDYENPEGTSYFYAATFMKPVSESLSTFTTYFRDSVVYLTGNPIRIITLCNGDCVYHLSRVSLALPRTISILQARRIRDNHLRSTEKLSFLICMVEQIEIFLLQTDQGIYVFRY